MFNNKNKSIKILATLGPASLKEEIVKNMDLSGVDLFRINLSHTRVEDLEEIVRKLKKWTEKPICFDSEGKQIRTGKMRDNNVFLKNNSIINLTSDKVIGDELNLPLYPIEPSKLFVLGDILYVDFLQAIVQVINIKGKKVLARVLSGGKVGSNKGVHINRVAELSSYTEKDKKAVKLANKLGIKNIALSFASSRGDIDKLRKFFNYPIFLISKIENRSALSNLSEICKASDAILIDRGDLSREVPLQKIGLAQKHILEIAKKSNTPVYIATNLLETMLESFEPTRAEVNDITSCLLSGAKGLVLAAETAIGKHPIESARMISGIIRSVEENAKNKKKEFLENIYDYTLIEPHGGVLVQNFVDLDDEDIKKIKKVKIDEETLLDAIQIAEGVYSPIRGFMNYRELLSVIEDYKLLNGVIWTLPILFQLDKKEINFRKNENIILEYPGDKNSLIYMKVSNIEEINCPKITEKWFGTDDINHPGVAKFIKKGNFIVSGEVYLARKSYYYMQLYNLPPKQTREIFKSRGWQKIVGFHTRNIIHRGHEFIQKKALDSVQADALFISPVVGPKKKSDFSAEAILKSYETMLRSDFYSPYPALIGSFNTYSRYSGPREAVFTALCRKNFGCSYFVVGRDHTGVANYYSPDASQKLFIKLGDIGIKPLIFNAAFYCKRCGKVTDSCSHSPKERLELSGSKVRNYLLKGDNVPEYLIRKEIFDALKMISKNKLFEK